MQPAGPIPLHNNARRHVTMITYQNLADFEYETLSHSSYFPDSHPPTTIFSHICKHFWGKKRSVLKEN